MVPWGNVASANITPDPSGISYYDEALFLEVMRTGQVKARKLSPIVPVMIYKNLSDDDLKAIFAFLRTVKPVKHRLDNTEPPIECSCASRNTARGMRTSSIPSGVTVRREHKERRRPGGCPGGRPRLPIESKGFHRKQQQGAGI